MKTFKITLTIIFISILVNSVRLGWNFPILHTLPLLGGPRPLIYQVASIFVLLITAWGCYRLRKNRNKDKQKQQDQDQTQRPESMGHFDSVNRYNRNYRY